MLTHALSRQLRPAGSAFLADHCRHQPSGNLQSKTHGPSCEWPQGLFSFGFDQGPTPVTRDHNRCAPHIHVHTLPCCVNPNQGTNLHLKHLQKELSANSPKRVGTVAKPQYVTLGRLMRGTSLVAGTLPRGAKMGKTLSPKLGRFPG